MTTTAPSFMPGDVRTRADIRKELGGSPYGGICPSKEKKTVILYSDLSAGKQYGYRDGWLKEDDDLGPVFEYTGAGTRGDQAFGGDFGKGNSAVLEHATEGRTIHLFIGEGKVPGTSTRTHRYIGCFKVDEDRPYFLRQALDENREKRNIIVFRLRPIGLVYRADADFVPPAPETKVTFVRSKAARRFEVPKRWRKAREQDSSKATVIARKREDLTSDFEAVLTEESHQVGRVEVQIEGKSDALFADLFDKDRNTLYEASGSVSRHDLKATLMQLLDISRYVRFPESGLPLRLMALLPELPDDDIRGLLTENNVGIIYRDETGGFSEFHSPRRAPATGGTAPIPCVGCPALAS
ncbi:MAG: hypothetical protein WCD21_42575 [Streptomyces sp.]